MNTDKDLTQHKIMKICTLAVALLTMAWGMTSCGSTKNLSEYTVTSDSLPATPTGTVASDKTSPDKFTPGNAANASQSGDSAEQWTTLTLPAKMKLYKPKNFSCSARITMERGVSTTISMRFLGMEVGCLHFDQDSLVLYEKMNHYMLITDMQRFTARSGMTVGDLQDLLIGSRDVEPLLEMLRNYTTSASAAYSDCYDTLYGCFPTLMAFEASTGKLEIDVEIELNFEKAEWNKPLKPFVYPSKSKYTQLDVNRLLHALKNSAL